MDVTDALLEAADEFEGQQPSDGQLAQLLRLHRHFACSDDTVDCVLAASAPVWCLHALLGHGIDSSSGREALQLVAALARSRRGRVLRDFDPDWRPDSFPAQQPSGQRWSPPLRAAAVAAERKASGSAGPQVVAIHCGDPRAGKAFKAAGLDANEALVAQLAAHLASSTAYPLSGVAVQPVPAADPRAGLAGTGRGLYATRHWPAFCVVGPYTAWVTCQTEFDARVPLLQRLHYESYAVTSRRRVRVCGERQSLMFVASPSEVADGTSQMNDWRCISPDGQPHAPPATSNSQAAGPSCQLVEVQHCGWLHIYVITVREVHPGEELTVQYPEGFWAARPQAAAVHAALDRAVTDRGEVQGDGAGRVGKKRRARALPDTEAARPAPVMPHSS